MLKLKDKSKTLLFKIFVVILMAVSAYGALLVADAVKAQAVNTSVKMFNPTNRQMYTVFPTEAKKVSFVVGIDDSSPQEIALMYIKEGDTEWSSFGNYPNTDINGQFTRPNRKVTTAMTNDGWACVTNYRLATTNSACLVTSSAARGTSTIAGNINSRITFPPVEFKRGVYHWMVKVRKPGSKLVSWSSTRTFGVAEVVTKVPTDKKMVAITFDDGPTSANTQVFCDILDSYNSKATFFFVGSRLANLPNEEAVANSCGEVGNHTLSHFQFDQSTSTDVAFSEIQGAANIINKDGYETNWFRPRGGVYTNDVLFAMLKTDEVLVNWDIKAGDYGPENPTKETIVSRVLDNPKLGPGSIILLHQTYAPTKEALPLILKGLKDQGYTVVTVSRLVFDRS